MIAFSVLAARLEPRQVRDPRDPPIIAWLVVGVQLQEADRETAPAIKGRGEP
jgi:hypothetical protein